MRDPHNNSDINKIKRNYQMLTVMNHCSYCFTHGNSFFGHRLWIGDIVICDGSKQLFFILPIKWRLKWINKKKNVDNSSLHDSKFTVIVHRFDYWKLEKWKLLAFNTAMIASMKKFSANMKIFSAVQYYLICISKIIISALPLDIIYA